MKKKITRLTVWFEDSTYIELSMKQLEEMEQARQVLKRLERLRE